MSRKVLHPSQNGCMRFLTLERLRPPKHWPWKYDSINSKQQQHQQQLLRNASQSCGVKRVFDKESLARKYFTLSLKFIVRQTNRTIILGREYVGVTITLCFMFSRGYRLGPHNEACNSLANIWGNTTKIGVEIEPPLNLLMLVKSACLLIPYFGYIGPPSRVHCWAWNSWYSLKV